MCKTWTKPEADQVTVVDEEYWAINDMDGSKKKSGNGFDMYVVSPGF